MRLHGTKILSKLFDISYYQAHQLVQGESCQIHIIFNLHIVRQQKYDYWTLSLLHDHKPTSYFRLPYLTEVLVSLLVILFHRVCVSQGATSPFRSILWNFNA